jgi:hypothetical protein
VELVVAVLLAAPKVPNWLVGAATKDGTKRRKGRIELENSYRGGKDKEKSSEDGVYDFDGDQPPKPPKPELGDGCC